jgi:hypothetical protein
MNSTSVYIYRLGKKYVSQCERISSKKNIKVTIYKSGSGSFLTVPYYQLKFPEFLISS